MFPLAEMIALIRYCLFEPLVKLGEAEQQPRAVLAEWDGSSGHEVVNPLTLASQMLTGPVHADPGLRPAVVASQLAQALERDRIAGKVVE